MSVGQIAMEGCVDACPKRMLRVWRRLWSHVIVIIGVVMMGVKEAVMVVVVMVVVVVEVKVNGIVETA